MSCFVFMRPGYALKCRLDLKKVLRSCLPPQSLSTWVQYSWKSDFCVGEPTGWERLSLRNRGSVPKTAVGVEGVTPPAWGRSPQTLSDH